MSLTPLGCKSVFQAQGPERKKALVVPLGHDKSSMERLWTARELAEATGMSVASVRKRVCRGTLPAIRFGKSLRFDPALVQEGTRRPREAITRMEAYQVCNRLGSLSMVARSHRKFHKAHDL